MKLADYLIQKQIGPSEFAELIGVSSRMTVHRYITGKRVPHPDMIQRITRVTRGAVTAADFPPPKKQVPTRMRRPALEQNNQRYPWERSDSHYCRHAEHALRRLLKEAPEGTDLSPPLQKAISLLGERVEMDREKRNFRLDHRPVSAQTLVRHANRILEAQEEPLIQYPGVNPIDN